MTPLLFVFLDLWDRVSAPAIYGNMQQ